MYKSLAYTGVQNLQLQTREQGSAQWSSPFPAGPADLCDSERWDLHPDGMALTHFFQSPSEHSFLIFSFTQTSLAFHFNNESTLSDRQS